MDLFLSRLKLQRHWYHLHPAEVPECKRTERSVTSSSMKLLNSVAPVALSQSPLELVLPLQLLVQSPRIHFVSGNGLSRRQATNAGNWQALMVASPRLKTMFKTNSKFSKANQARVNPLPKPKLL